MKRSMIFIVGILVWIMSSACSNDLSPTVKKQELVKPENFQASKDTMGMLKEGPGKYAGEKYDEAAFHKILDQLPQGISGQEIYNQLIFYLAENYEPYIKGLQEVDTVFQTDFQQDLPEGTNGTSNKGKIQANVVILLDASGSMRGKLDDKDKMTLAKDAVKKFASKMPQGTQITLRVYGHKGSGSNRDKAVSCNTTETVYPRGSYDEQKFDAALNRFQPSGWTPLAKAIEETKKDFGTQSGAKNVVYVVSDGKETCDGDPVKAAQTLNQSDIEAIVNIIGFNVKDQEQAALKAIADAGQGEYIQADTPDQLTQKMQKEYTRLWLEWNRWGTTSWLDVQKQFNQKWSDLAQHRKQLDKRWLQERKRLDEAMLYLRKKDILDAKSFSELGDLIRQRNKAIHDYYQSMYQEKNQLLTDTRKEIQDRIKNKQKEMQDKYDATP